MNASRFPVTVAVKRGDGSTEQVQVGFAVREGDGFRLSLGDLTIGAAAPSAQPRPSSAPPPPADGGLVFPSYGRSKGMPIAGASRQDLEFYAGGCRRTLGDPSKSRWHDKERVLLAAIESELARSGADSAGGGAGGGYARGSGPVPRDFDAPPPPADEDIPF